MLFNFKLTVRILSWLKLQSKAQIPVFPIPFFPPDREFLPLLFSFFYPIPFFKNQFPFSGMARAGWVRLSQCLQEADGSRSKPEMRPGDAKGDSRCFSSSASLPQIALLHPNVSSSPPQNLYPSTVLLNLSPPPSQPGFSHHLCWWALKAVPCSVCGRYREHLALFLEPQRATSRRVRLSHGTHGKLCVQSPYPNE